MQAASHPRARKIILLPRGESGPGFGGFLLAGMQTGGWQS
jgi:hypothetical protein